MTHTGRLPPSIDALRKEFASDVGCPDKAGFAESDAATIALLGLDAGRPNHLAELLGFVGDELSEVSGGGAHKHHAAPVDKLRAFSLGSPRPALIELVDGLGGRCR
jgi:hypothetical protein